MENESKPAAADPDQSPRRSRRRGWIAAGVGLIVAVVAVFLVAQGGGGGGSPLNAIAKAAEVTQREPGGRAVISSKITNLNSPETVTESGEMTFDENDRARGELTVDLRPAGKEVKVVTVVDGTTSYTTSDVLDGELPEGKKWLGIDLSSATKGLKHSDPISGGPTEGLKVLERVQESEEVGKEEIDGVPTTHYRGTLETAEEVFGAKVEYAPPQIDVWIDGQSRVRKMEIAITDTVGDVSTKTEMTIDFVEFGRVPKIEVPPASEVFDGTSKIEAQVQAAAEGG